MRDSQNKAKVNVVISNSLAKANSNDSRSWPGMVCFVMLLLAGIALSDWATTIRFALLLGTLGLVVVLVVMR